MYNTSETNRSDTVTVSRKSMAPNLQSGLKTATRFSYLPVPDHTTHIPLFGFQFKICNPHFGFQIKICNPRFGFQFKSCNALFALQVESAKSTSFVFSSKSAKSAYFFGFQFKICNPLLWFSVQNLQSIFWFQFKICHPLFGFHQRDFFQGVDVDSRMGDQ